MNQEVEKFVNREQRLRELQRQNLSPTKSGLASFQQSHSSKYVDQLRQNEEKIDQDFTRLMERYNQSKSAIQTMFQQGLGGGASQAAAAAATQAQGQGQSLFGRSIRTSPQHKSDDFYVQPSTTKATQNTATFNTRGASSRGFDEAEPSGPSIRQSKESVAGLLTGGTSPNLGGAVSGSGVKASAYGGKQSTSQGGGGGGARTSGAQRDKSITKSLQSLKKTINLKETIEQNKLQQQINLTQDLQQSLRDYVQRTQQLEEGLRAREEVIGKYEIEIKNAQEDLLFNLERQKEMKIKEESWLKLEEELRETNLALKGKIARKKQKVKLLREQNLDFQKTLEEFRDVHDIDSQKLREALEDLNLQARNKEEKIQDLEQLIKSLKDAEQAKSIEQQHHVQTLEAKIDELRDVQAQLEAKIAKNKIKFEEEKRTLTDEKAALASRKKQKVAQLKRQYTESSERVIKLEKDLLQAQQQQENTHSQLVETEKFSNEQRAENKRLVDELTFAKSNIATLQQEVDRLQGQINVQDEKARQQQKIIDQEALSSNQLKADLLEANNQNQNLSEHVRRLETQIEYLHRQQSAEINEIEGKIDGLIGEIKQLKDENGEYKQRESQLRRQLAQSEELQNSFKEKYLKAKNTNKSLREHLKEVEDKVKDYMHERNSQIREQEKEREQARAVDLSTKNKLRLLDEIQNMIRQHKTHMTASKFE